MLAAVTGCPLLLGSIASSDAVVFSALFCVNPVSHLSTTLSGTN